MVYNMKIDIRPRRSLLNPELRRPSALSSLPRDGKSLWLDKNENLDAEFLAVSRKQLLDMPLAAMATYPEAGEAYRKLARWVGCVPGALIFTPGSDGAIRLVFEAFVEHGEGVVHTSPTFAMYPVYCQMFGAQSHAIEYQSSGIGPCLDPQAIIDAVSRYKPKLLCLPNPDSPTGALQSPQVLRRILGACEAAGTVFLMDEAYHPFHEWSAVPWTQTSRHLIVARTFAKAWGAAGLRIGYAVAHPDTVLLLHKMRPMYEVSTFAVEFVTRLLDRAAAMALSVARINKGKDYFAKRMRALGFTTLPTAGNFIHVGFGEQGAKIHEALAGRVLYRASFEHPCLAGYSRFSTAPESIMSPVADMIQEAMKK